MKKIVQHISIALIIATCANIATVSAKPVYNGYATRVMLSTDDRFDFGDFPTTVQPFEDITFTLQALTAALEVNVSYSGTVTFEVDSDENAKLPTDYTFVPADGGEHTFTNAIYFVEEGEHTLIVKDKDNEALQAQFVVTVSENANSGSGNGEMSITSPSAGTSSTNVISFAGIVDAGLEVRVLDNGTILGKTNAGADGKFTYNSPVLGDGAHTFVVETDTATSAAIDVNISTSSAIISSLKVDPAEVAPGAVANFTLTLTEAANSVSATVNNVKVDLAKFDAAGKVFKGTMTAPTIVSSYPISLKIVTQLGSTVNVALAGNLVVTDGFGLGAAGGLTFNVPSQVLGINAIPQDKRVTLTWNPATDNTGIQNYAIFYGADINNLATRVNTNDASTTWFIPELTNGTRYYFRVFGVDTEGNMSDQGSVIVSAIPGVDGSTTLHGSADGQVLVDGTASTGPGNVLVLLLISVACASFIRSKRIFV